MGYNKKIYIKLLNENKFEEADIYRTSNMPKTLFKYISLNDSIKCEQIEGSCRKCFNLNELKFNSLENDKLWLSAFQNLNDPFEYKSLFIDIEKLEQHKWPIEFVKSAFQSIADAFVIASFTTTAIDNMPMWAHYANNHQGFCVEYEVINSKLIFPISYEKYRVPMASIITNYIDIAYKLWKGTITANDNDYKLYTHIVLHNALIKHKSWKYENEYRIVSLNPIREQVGASYSLNSLGLKVKRIFIGKSCSIENRKRLINIAKNKNLEVFDTVLEEQSKLYRLGAKIVL